MTTTATATTLRIRDADETLTEIELVVQPYGAIEAWATRGERRLIFSVGALFAQALADEIHTAICRYDAMRLEEREVAVDIDPDSGLLTASVGWCRLRRAVVGETGGAWPQKRRSSGVTKMTAPVEPERTWHESEVRGWNVWERETYLRLLDALMAAEASRRNAVSA